MSEQLLEVQNLRVALGKAEEALYPVDDVSFSLGRDEILAVVGESGSGKTMTSLAVMGLLPPTGMVASGSIRWKGEELVGLEAERFQQLRGSEISMIFQDPMTSLNPVMTIEAQMTEAIRAHQSVSKTEAKRIAEQALEDVGIPEPGKRLRAYPHELSGGMRQRVMISMALVNSPDLLIADEPTTALDVTIQAQVLELLLEIQQRTHCAILIITHDLGVVAGLAQHVLVMYAGRMAEMGSTEDVFYRSAHPYTQGLLRAVPQVTSDRLIPIPGQPPSLRSVPSGCAFNPRCEFAQPLCADQQPTWREVQSAHSCACHFAEEVMNTQGASS